MFLDIIEFCCIEREICVSSDLSKIFIKRRFLFKNSCWAERIQMPEELSISEDGNQIVIRSYGQISKKDLVQVIEKVDHIHHRRGITKVLDSFDVFDCLRRIYNCKKAIEMTLRMQNDVRAILQTEF